MSAQPATLVLLALAVAGLLVAERRNSERGLWLTKPLAAALYFVIALQAGALDSAYGRAVLAALFLCWWGDVLLIPRDRTSVFRAGILAFLLGHVAYAVAFVIRGVDWVALIVPIVVMTPVAWFIYRWLGDRVPAELQGAVVAYIVVISTMFALAVGTHVKASGLIIIAGAGLFWISDLFVARDRFVKRGFENRLIGLPLYFAAQVLLALSV